LSISISINIFMENPLFPLRKGLLKYLENVVYAEENSK
jgi:hypothetical protein